MDNRKKILKHFEEQKELMDARVNSGIELYRKGYARIKFTDANGNEIKNLTFKAKQKTHDFNFGCNLFLLDEFENENENKLYRDEFAKIFNYATLPFYHNGIEPRKGYMRFDKNSEKKYRRPAPDLAIEYCTENNIRMKGHCLEYSSNKPEWFPKYVPEIKNEIKKYMTTVIERYGDIISDWDILNEPTAPAWKCYGGSVTPFYREDDYINYTFNIASKLSIKRKFINDDTTTCWENFRFTRSAYYMLLKIMEYENVPFDAIGLQFHEHVLRDKEEEFAASFFVPSRIYDVLDTYGKFGKPIQISEVTLNSYSGDEEDEYIQAELVKNMYKIWFSHERMDGIIYWNLVDGYAWAGPDRTNAKNMAVGENVYGGGLLTPYLEPKQSYKVLDELINKEWHTEGIYKTNADSGNAMFRGFKGLYEIEVKYNGKKYIKSLHLDSRDDYITTIVLE